MKAILLFLLSITSLNLFAEEQADRIKVTWGRTDFPPGFILEGKYQGLGYGDLLNEFMSNSLDEFEHESVVYPNFARLIREIHQSKNRVVCTSTLFYRPATDRTEIEGKQLISAPNFVFFLHDIIVRKSKRHLYPDIVSLKTLLANQNLTFGYSRTTGPKSSRIIGDYIGVNKDISTMSVNDRIKALASKKNILIRLGPNMVGGPMQMMLRDRIDYILEYEFMIDFEAKRLGKEGEFYAIAVEETLDDISMGAYSCSDTAKGKKVIQAINRVLIERRATAEYKQLLHYLLPKNTGRIERYWQEYQKILNIMY